MPHLPRASVESASPRITWCRTTSESWSGEARGAVAWEPGPPPVAVPVIAPSCCCWPGPPEKRLVGTKMVWRWQPQSEEPACGARGRGRCQGVARSPSVPPGGPRSLATARRRPDQMPCFARPYLQQLRKRWKAGTASSCCSSPCPPGTSPLGGSKTWHGAQGWSATPLPWPATKLPVRVPRSSHTWLRTWRTPLVARRSARHASVLHQTLWKAAGRAQETQAGA